jgi:hypothetical protein
MFTAFVHAALNRKDDQMVLARLISQESCQRL